MEPRYRTILPIVGILFVIIVALIAFFIARRVRNAATTENTPEPTASAVSLLLPSGSGSPTPAGTRMPGATSQSSSLINPQPSGITRQPRTGPEDETTQIFSVAFDDQGFRQPTITITSGTKLNWYNLGNGTQAIEVEGLSSGPIANGAIFSYVFAAPKTYTVKLTGSLSSPSQSQAITVQ